MESLVQRVLWLQIPTRSTVEMWLIREFRKQSMYNPFPQQGSGLQSAPSQASEEQTLLPNWAGTSGLLSGHHV